MDNQIDEWMDEQMDKWMDDGMGMNRQMEERINGETLPLIKIDCPCCIAQATSRKIIYKTTQILNTQICLCSFRDLRY